MKLTILLGALAALALAACAGAPGRTAESPTMGRLYHYLRTNADGSLPEDIYVYRASPTLVEVAKIVSRCANAAYVTAELDLERRQPRALVGGRIARDATQDTFAWLSYDAGQLHARVPSLGVDARTGVTHEPWIIYDFDLSELTALHAGAPAPREDFAFGVALIWPDGSSDNSLRDLGVANAAYEGEADGLARYRVSGALNGAISLDAHDGHVVEASFAEPNHLEYQNFHLRLQSVEDNAAAAWREIRTAHWRDCP
jgi:hypothetical protein